MKILSVLAILATLSGCAKPMANEDIIREAKKCLDAGLTPEFDRLGTSGLIAGVQCGQPKGAK